MNIRKNF